MKKQWVLVGILAGSLCASDALAQHQTPNQQPNTATAPTAPTGDLALGTRAPAEGGDGGRQAAPGRHLPGQADRAGSQARRRSAPRRTLERWVEFAQGGRSRAAKSSASSRRPRSRWSSRTRRRRPELESAGPERQRIRSRLDQQRRESLPDPPAGERRDRLVNRDGRKPRHRRGLRPRPAPEQLPLRSPSRRTARDGGACPA